MGGTAILIASCNPVCLQLQDTFTSDFPIYIIIVTLIIDLMMIHQDNPFHLQMILQMRKTMIGSTYAYIVSSICLPPCSFHINEEDFFGGSVGSATSAPGDSLSGITSGDTLGNVVLKNLKNGTK